jgi:aminopeptidase N
MKKYRIHITMLIWYLLTANTIFAYNRQDTLRGSNGNGRNWWDVTYYNLSTDLYPATQSISGDNEILFTVTGTPSDSLQLDLQSPMEVDSVYLEASVSHSDAEFNLKLYQLAFAQEGNVWWVMIPESNKNLVRGGKYKLTVYYHGKPRIAKNPPWDGGLIWTKDEKGNSWTSVACQGLGASAWWPCKDYQDDEPDNGIAINITHPKGPTIVSNGRMSDEPYTYFDSTTNEERQGAMWEVKNPINTYNLSFYIGDYVHWTDTLMGENGKLDLDFYALRHNESKARKQFAEAKQMLHCFEYWMGPYPFYEDGYKLVEAPFLGMEHQSAVAYGNEYKQGYRGKDRSSSGFGMLFDFIIIHESGHEWFGNNITAKDIADNWLHEGFTTYTEELFLDCYYGKDTAFAYTRGQWKNIVNTRPVIDKYGVNDSGPGDKYDKGSAIVHMVRKMINDDAKFRELMRSLNKKYYHKTVTSAEVEEYISDFANLQLKPFFDQYLRTTQIPEIEWFIKDKKLNYKFNNVVPGFMMPIQVSANKTPETILVKGQWQSIPWKRGGYNVTFSEDFLITAKP